MKSFSSIWHMHSSDRMLAGLNSQSCIQITLHVTCVGSQRICTSISGIVAVVAKRNAGA